MAKKIHLSIPKPCHEDWKQMTPFGKGRFCGSCEKQVIDFSRMSEREIAIFFKKPKEENVCGRFRGDQLNHAIDIPRKRIPWLRYFFQVAIPAFFLSSRAMAQGEVKGRIIPDSLRCLVKKTPAKFSQQELIPIQPTKALTDFKIESLPKIIVDEPLYYFDNSGLEGIVGGLVMEYYNEEQVEIIPPVETEPDPGGFKVFPNPISQGMTTKIEWKVVEEGYHYLMLLDQSGKMVWKQESWVDGKNRVMDINFPPLSAGIYFLEITNKKMKKKFTQKVVIQ